MNPALDPLAGPSGSPIVRFGAWLLAFILVLTGPVSGFALARIFLEARASAAWPSVPGTLTWAGVRTETFGGYFADVAYTYRVGDEEFTGTRLRTSDGKYSDREGATQAIRGLSPGQRVTVYYNPASPEKSVLYPGAGVQEYVLLLVPVAVEAAGVWALVRLWRTR